MYCRKCGKIIQDDSLFYESWGEKTSRIDNNFVQLEDEDVKAEELPNNEFIAINESVSLQPLPMNWYKFLTYLYLPVGLIITIILNLFCTKKASLNQLKRRFFYNIIGGFLSYFMHFYTLDYTTKKTDICGHYLKFMFFNKLSISCFFRTTNRTNYSTFFFCFSIMFHCIEAFSIKLQRNNLYTSFIATPTFFVRRQSYCSPYSSIFSHIKPSFLLYK